MFDGSISRRQFVGGAVAMASAGALPAWATGMPSVDDVAFDPAIPAFANPDGDVTIVEFVDYQCMICKLVFAELMKLLDEDQKVRLVIKDWPIFGDVSRYTAQMTLATAGTDNYRNVVGTLMADKRRLSKGRTDRILGEAGADPRSVRQSLEAQRPAIDAVLMRNSGQATEFGLRGTPALLIGKRLYRRGMPLNELKLAVAEARAA